MDGFFNVDKPAGPTSHDVVQRIRKLSREKQVGHGGTLDPLATGVLPIGVGHGTRLLEFIAGPKVYRAEIEFGVVTDTYDAAGQVTERHDPSGLRREQVAEACRPFTGPILQRPPLYSAVKHQGKRLYQYARKGIEVERPPRPVTIYRLDVLAWESPVATVEVECSRGTYTRSLAYDLGQAVGCGAYLKSLVRRQDGEFRVEESVPLADLEAALQSGAWEDLLYPLDFPIRGWPGVVLRPPRDFETLSGQMLPLLPGDLPSGLPTSDAAPAGPPERLLARGVNTGGVLLALLEYRPERSGWHPFKVFPKRGRPAFR
ncbi:MAG: tRNA pseudouridine(55) synthase TruB [Chloroflexi bacterium]|nr:tRNA pseudouridine(55) synthase TruB [Chloroflexota bacterium]